MIKPLSRLGAALVAACLSLPAAAQTTTMIVMDGSGSMWGQIDGRTKLEIARETLAGVLVDLPGDLELGLMAYGHRERGNCADIELMVAPAAGSAPAMLEAVNTMRFQGKTPLTEAVRQAAEALRSTEEPATVVLVTDGIETCAADPCALAAELETSGVDFTAHVIGFGLTKSEGAEVACIAENTGGQYYEAGDSAALTEALTSAVVDEGSPPAAAPTPERVYYPGAPMMEAIALAPTGKNTGLPDQDLPEFTLPADGIAAQCAALCDAEALCAAWRYEPGTDSGSKAAICTGYGASTEMDYTTEPAEAGFASGIKDGVLLLVRPYIPSGPLPEASLDAPASAAIGQSVSIGWTGPAAELDTIEIGLPGDGERWGWDYVAAGNPLSLIMPGEPGLYELRYKFRDQIGIATREIEVLAAEVSMAAPAQVLAGAEISVGWTGPNAPYDNIQIAEAGSDSYLTYAYVTAGNPLVMTAPDAPGRYELRYKLSDTEVIAARPFEVLAPGSPLAPEVGLVPVTIQADPMGAAPISWSATPLDLSPPAQEAVAMPEAFSGPWLAELAPGRWHIEGQAEGGLAYAADIAVSDATGQVFDIPVGFESKAMGEDTPPVALPGTSATDEATGLTVMLPEGWSVTEAFFAETAAGVAAERPSGTFSGPDGHLLVLNPLQWLESNGTCYDSSLGPLCVFGAEDPVTDAAVNLILPSLSLPTLTPDFGGTSFKPQGKDPMPALVPGWSVE